MFPPIEVSTRFGCGNSRNEGFIVTRSLDNPHRYKAPKHSWVVAHQRCLTIAERPLCAKLPKGHQGRACRSLAHSTPGSKCRLPVAVGNWLTKAACPGLVVRNYRVQVRHAVAAQLPRSYRIVPSAVDGDARRYAWFIGSNGAGSKGSKEMLQRSTRVNWFVPPGECSC